jgi:transposase
LFSGNHGTDGITGVGNDTAGVGTGEVSDATLLLDLEGLAVSGVQRAPDGGRVVHLVTADETAAACPACGALASRVKEYVGTHPRDLPCGGDGLRLAWRKRRWHCDQPRCVRASFTESVSAVPARARSTSRLRAHGGRLVVDGLCATVSAAARITGLSWPTVMDAVHAQAGPLAEQAPAPVEILGIDEVRRGPHLQPADQVLHLVRRLGHQQSALTL